MLHVYFYGISTYVAIYDNAVHEQEKYSPL